MRTVVGTYLHHQGSVEESSKHSQLHMGVHPQP